MAAALPPQTIDTAVVWSMFRISLFITEVWVVQIHIVFSLPTLPDDSIFFYAEHFTFSSEYKAINDDVEVMTTAPGIDMFILHQHFSSNNECIGDIYPLTAIQEPVDLVPIFGRWIDQGIDCNNFLDVPTSF